MAQDLLHAEIDHNGNRRVWLADKVVLQLGSVQDGNIAHGALLQKILQIINVKLRSPVVVAAEQQRRVAAPTDEAHRARL